MKTSAGPSPATSYQMSTPLWRLKGILSPLSPSRDPSAARQELDCILAGERGADQFEPGRLRKRRERKSFEGVDSVRSYRFWGAQQRGFVDQIRAQHSGGDDRPGLDHEPRDAALGQ